MVNLGTPTHGTAWAFNWERARRIVTTSFGVTDDVGVRAMLELFTPEAQKSYYRLEPYVIKEEEW